jgi:ribosomal protein S18 acetylase RimI-like enzyme
MTTNAPLSLRPARPADGPAIIAILHDTFNSTWRPQISASAARAFLDEDRPAAYFARRGLQFRVAERQGEVVGFVDWEGDFVNALHVLGRHAGAGVGSVLMDRAEAGIADSGFAAARLETDTFNLRSQAFYRARGYREADCYPDEEWNSDLVTLLLIKSLG